MFDIRVAEPGDLDGVVDLWSREGGPSRRPGSRDEAEMLLARDAEALIVALMNGKVVGAVIAGWDGWRFHIYRLAVDRAARRQGIARRLMAVALQRAEAIGAARIDAMVDPDNAIAMAFWQSIGYELDRDVRLSRFAG
jgi:ribosomal protein S18 acetylase RimI-like enzyme